MESSDGFTLPTAEKRGNKLSSQEAATGRGGPYVKGWGSQGETTMARKKK